MANRAMPAPTAGIMAPMVRATLGPWGLSPNSTIPADTPAREFTPVLKTMALGGALMSSSESIVPMAATIAVSAG